MYLARVFRRMGGEIRQIARAATPTHGALRDRLMALVVATIGIDLVCAGLAYALEHGVRGSQLRTYGDALFWTSTQLLTVSSQIQNPFTTGGKILDVAMEAYAISFVATLAGSMGTFLIRRARELEQGAEAAAHGGRPR